MAFFRAIDGPLEGTRYPVSSDRAETLIGRDGTCDIVLPFGTVSRCHARIFREGDDWIIEDRGSINGTFVNGRRLRNRTVLRHGDRVNIYHVGLRFAHSGLSSTTPAESSAVLQGGVQPEEANSAAEETAILGSVPDLPPETAAPAHVQLRSISEISRRLGSSFDLEDILPRVLDLLFEICPDASTGQILLVDADRRLIPRALKHGREDDSSIFDLRPVDHELAAEVIRGGTTSVRSGTQSESALDDSSGCSVNAPVIGPAGRCLGVICLELEGGRGAARELELELIEAVAASVGQAVEHAEAHHRLLEADRQRERLQAARDVQQGMLPRSCPEMSGYRLADHYAAAEEVGGDCYDYLRLRDGRLIITLGDIAGKGMTAALRMARLTAVIRHCILSARSVKSAMRRLHGECFRSDMGFITFVLCLLDPDRHVLTVANAGHPPPLLRDRSTGRVRPLRSERDGHPFGIAPDQVFHPTTWELAPGDLLLLYSDGLPEAMNPANELFGPRRIRECLAAPHESLGELLERILAELGRFRAGRPPSDDLCLVSLMREH